MREKSRNPFPGLRPFREEEEHLFFGRDTALSDLLSRLRLSRFLGVIGSSGCGKSSLIRAGLIPSLYRGFMSGTGSKWRIAIMRPGDNPIKNLSRALIQAGISADSEISKEFSEPTLRRSTRGLTELFRQEGLHDENLLIIVDQFEEIFPNDEQAKKSQRREHDLDDFIDLLLESSRQREIPIYILIAMRSEYLGECSEFRGLPEAINSSFYLIPRMTREELRSVISGPIAVGQANISSTLLTCLLNDVGDNQDQLPVLQHALMRTWDFWAKNNRNGEPIDLKHYTGIGTMKEALSRHAEAAYKDLDDKQKDICEKIFKSLIAIDEKNQKRRWPTKLGVLCRITAPDEERAITEVIEVINVFRSPGRTFLMPPEEKLDSDKIIDISHESLFRLWDRYKIWAKEEEEKVKNFRQLSEKAVVHEKEKGDFLGEIDLHFALEWRKKHKPNPAWAERYSFSLDQVKKFIKNSEKKLNKEKKLVRKRKKIINIIFIIFVLIITCLAIWAYKSKIKAEKATESANGLRMIALNEKDKVKKALEELEYANKNAEISRENEKLAKQQTSKKEIERQKAEMDSELYKMKSALSKRETLAAKEEQYREKIQGLNSSLDADKETFKGKLESAKKLALESQRISDTELKTLLALAAYSINERAYDNLKKQTQENFKSFDIKSMKEFEGKQELKKGYEKFKTECQRLLKVSQEKFVPSKIFEALREAYVAEENSKDILYQSVSRALSVTSDNRIIFNDKNGELVVSFIRYKLPEFPVLSEPIYLPKNNAGLSNVIVNTNKKLFCGTRNGNIFYWEINNLEERNQLVKKGDPIIAMVYSPLKRWIIYLSNKGLFRHDLQNKNEIFQLQNDELIRTLSLVEDQENSFLIIPNNNDRIYYINLFDPSLIKNELNTDSQFKGCEFQRSAYSPSQKLLAFANSKGEILISPGVDTNTFLSKTKINFHILSEKHDGNLSTLLFSPSGKYLASGGLDDTIMLWNMEFKRVDDLATLSPIITFPGAKSIRSVVFEKDENFLIFSDNENLRICPTRPEIFFYTLCNKERRNLTKKEWNKYLGESSEYEKLIICPPDEENNKKIKEKK